MELLLKNQIITQLQQQIPAWQKSCAAEKVILLERHYNEVLCHLGYSIIKNKQTYEVYQSYLKYDNEQLIALTPIWTFTHVNAGKAYQKKGYELLEDVIDALRIA